MDTNRRFPHLDTILDNRPTVRLVHGVKTLGIFEAKTRFTALCEEVVRTGRPTLIQKRGRPMVLVTPVPPELSAQRPGILAAWQRWQEAHPRDHGEFPPVWRMRGRISENPLAE